MGVGITVERDIARMDRRIARYESGEVIVLTAATAMTSEAMDRGITIAHEELQRAVYSTPEGTYQRTYALFNAPQRQKLSLGVASGQIFMSEGTLRSINPDARRFIYIRAVEFGHGGPVPAEERPYWRPTMMRIKAEYFATMGPAAAHEIAEELKR